MGQQGAGSREQVAGSREHGAGSREQGAGSREQGAGSREQGAGSREQGAGSREQGAGSRDGAVVRALASHQCGPGSIPGLGVIRGSSLLLVLVPAPRGFSLGTPVLPSPQNPTLLNSNSIWKVSPISALRAKYIDT